MLYKMNPMILFILFLMLISSQGKKPYNDTLTRKRYLQHSYRTKKLKSHGGEEPPADADIAYSPSETGWFEGPTSAYGPLYNSRYRIKHYWWCAQYNNDDPTSWCLSSNNHDETICENPPKCESAPHIILRKKVNTTSTSNCAHCDIKTPS